MKNAKLSNDLAAIDQAIQMYRMDNGSLPESLTSLDSSYLGGKLEFKDALGEGISYTPSGSSYSLTGKNASGTTISSPASKVVNAEE